MRWLNTLWDQNWREGKAHNRRLRRKVTPITRLAEIYVKILKVERWELAEKTEGFYKGEKRLALLDERIVVEAVKIDRVMKKKVREWKLADSTVYTTGLVKNAKIVTGD